MDITYIRTNAGFVYLALVLDTFSPEIIGCIIATAPHTALTGQRKIEPLWQIGYDMIHCI